MHFRKEKLQFSPHNVAICFYLKRGRKNFYQYICWKTGKFNPDTFAENVTTLHVTAGIGDFETTRFIIDNVDDKNPASRAQLRVTPLHMAAKRGQLEICKLIIASVKDKNPGDNCGITPLHEAASEGFFEVCEFIIGKEGKKRFVTNSECYYGIWTKYPVVIE